MNGVCWAKANFDGPETGDRPWPPFPFDRFDVVDLGFWSSNELDVCSVSENIRDARFAWGL